MGRVVKGSQLIPGKMYTLWGRSNFSTWPIYLSPPTIDKEVPVTGLFPLEPFVFLERTMSDFRYNNEDPMYDYKILTGSGVIGWLSLHDDDLHTLGICFCEYHPEDYEVKL